MKKFLPLKYVIKQNWL